VLRSLNSEHVFAEALLRTESERPTPLGAALRRSRQRDLPVADDVVLGVLRRWFFSRAADRGFSLVGFPQNLCQALVFDEWLDARGESLNACLLPDASTSASPVATHYCNQGLLREVSFPSHPIAVSA
jgi:adenylate kinase